MKGTGSGLAQDGDQGWLNNIKETKFYFCLQSFFKEDMWARKVSDN
jgi:hypothetical protein